MRTLTIDSLVLGGLLSLACEADLGGSLTMQGEGPTPGSTSGLGGGGASGQSPGPTTQPHPTVDDACAERTVAVQPLRRLSSTQYENTIVDLFGEELARPFLEGSTFPTTVIERGFGADAEANTVNESESDAIIENAQMIGATILHTPGPYVAALLPCDVAQDFADHEIDECVPDFIESFGKRAYRRPLSTDEKDLVKGLYDDLRAEQSAVEAWSAVIQFFVQSPGLLYRVERGADPLDNTELVRLSDHEMASRLSFFLTESMPDAALLKAADAGELTRVEDILAHARRLIDGERFESAFGAFHRDWLHLYELADAGKDRDLFPEFSEELRSELLSESGRFANYVLREENGSIQQLLGGDVFPVTPALADLYGLRDAHQEGWEPTSLPHRVGLLTQASVMATLATTAETNPIHRGAFLLEEVLCFDIPALPGDVDLSGPLEDTSGRPTARERLEPLLTRGDCRNCHRTFNPAGLALESYDALGKYRVKENGEDIDASGEIPLDGEYFEFDDAEQMVRAIAASNDASICYAHKWYENALGRPRTKVDDCSLALVRERLNETGGDIVELLLSIVSSDAFLYRAPQVVPAAGD